MRIKKIKTRGNTKILTLNKTYESLETFLQVDGCGPYL